MRRIVKQVRCVFSSAGPAKFAVMVFGHGRANAQSFHVGDLSLLHVRG